MCPYLPAAIGYQMMRATTHNRWLFTFKAGRAIDWDVESEWELVVPGLKKLLLIRRCRPHYRFVIHVDGTGAKVDVYVFVLGFVMPLPVCAVHVYKKEIDQSIMNNFQTFGMSKSPSRSIALLLRR
jgi:hypothetical protein